jgi:hypothetical protein
MNVCSTQQEEEEDGASYDPGHDDGAIWVAVELTHNGRTDLLVHAMQ